jgi:60 kDa SS-A/Ro ribonucleoprotein
MPYQPNIIEAAKNLHPVASLSAWRVYTNGRGEKGTLTWTPAQGIGAALEHGFNESFGQLKRSTAKVCFGLDVSGSMDSNQSTVAGLNCREVAAAMVMVAMRQQPYMLFGFGSSLIPLEIRDTWSLNEVIRYLKGHRFGATDCSLPMRHCAEQGFSDVDLFAIYTDNETNQRVKPSDALNAYRRSHNPNAKLATVALQGGAFSIADPSDPGQVDFVGFDPSVPTVMVQLAEQSLV